MSTHLYLKKSKNVLASICNLEIYYKNVTIPNKLLTCLHEIGTTLNIFISWFFRKLL